MTEEQRAGIDPQEHIDACYNAAGLLREEAECLKDSHTVAGIWERESGEEYEAYKSMHAAADSLDTAADAYADLKAERDELLAALVEMVQEPQPLGIERESYQTALALVIKYHDDVDSPEAWAARKAAA